VTVTLAIDKGGTPTPTRWGDPVPPDFPGKPTVVRVEAKVKRKR